MKTRAGIRAFPSLVTLWIEPLDPIVTKRLASRRKKPSMAMRLTPMRTRARAMTEETPGEPDLKAL